MGYETGCGDPLFVDTGVSELPVFTAMHGEGAWEPVQVAISVEAFAKCIEEFSRISVGRNNRVEREANPVSDGERVAFLQQHCCGKPDQRCARGLGSAPGKLMVLFMVRVFSPVLLQDLPLRTLRRSSG